MSSSSSPAIVAVALIAWLTACSAKPGALTTLVIDKVILHTASEGGPPGSLCIVQQKGSSSYDYIFVDTFPLFNRLTWGYYQQVGQVGVGRLELKPVTIRDTVTIHIANQDQNCRVGGFARNSSNSFPAGTGFTRLRQDSMSYTVFYHME